MSWVKPEGLLKQQILFCLTKVQICFSSSCGWEQIVDRKIEIVKIPFNNKASMTLQSLSNEYINFLSV
jgi:hypothetical protein